jgi:preprotein translocase subunit YajC
MAFLALTQDYISSVLNGNYFDVGESLSFKLFWLLFIPALISFFYVLEICRARFSHTVNFAFTAFLILVATLSHLLLFSLLLFVTLNTIDGSSWSLTYLITMKLSSRLYIAISVYIGFTVMYFWLNHLEQKKQQGSRESISKLTVKNGHKTILVDVDKISWISSDGAYLNIHTANKKYVILDSLKNIITSLPENFKRIHRSTIVNIDQVDGLESRGNGDYDLRLDSGKELRLSRNYVKPLKGLLL